MNKQEFLTHAGLKVQTLESGLTSGGSFQIRRPPK